MSDPLLVLDGVSKYHGGVAAISELSLAVDAGSIVAVVGAAGAGKTTLVNLIAGACPPDGGRLWFAGRDLTGRGAHRFCIAGIARTFDPPRPFPTLRVIDTVTIPALLHEPDPAAARRRTLDLLELLELRPLAHRPAASLAPAEARRLELARALATRPRLLVLDQMLTELPEAGLARLQDTLLDLNRRRRPGLTLILLEPRLSPIQALADRLVLLDHGQIITEVSPHDLSEVGDTNLSEVADTNLSEVGEQSLSEVGDTDLSEVAEQNLSEVREQDLSEVADHDVFQ